MARDGNKIVLKSSNSNDFVWRIIDKLAEMYVDIQPVLAPTRYAVQKYVETLDDIERFKKETRMFDMDQKDKKVKKTLIQTHHTRKKKSLTMY